MAAFSRTLALILGVMIPHAGMAALPIDALAIGGIALGDAEASVTAHLGQPATRRNTVGLLKVELGFSGLTVWLYEDGRVGEILSTDPAYCTSQGICPGHAFDHAKSIYGEPLIVDREDGQFMEYYPESGDTCWLQMAVESGTIKSIRSECQP